MSRHHSGDAFLLDIVADLKDRVVELEHTRQATSEPATQNFQRQLAPPNRPGEAWAPCTPEEVAFYGSFKHLA